MSSLDSILAQPELSPALYGICVFDLSNDSVIYARNCQKLLVPASNMKLITTAASLVYLGPHFKYKTKLASNGTIYEHSLKGDIILIGGGDPTLRLNHLERFVKKLKEKGINRITGNIVLDDQYFTELSLNGNNFRFERLPVGWAWHYLDARYAPEISALSVNKNVVNVKMEATGVGNAAEVELEPAIDYITLISRMITKSGEDSIIILRRPESNIIYVDGGISEDRVLNIEVAVRDPALFAGNYFREQLIKNGIACHGGIKRWYDDDAYTGNRAQPLIVLDSVLSAPLSEILRETNMESINLYAEVFLKTLGVHYHKEGSFRAGLLMLKKFLARCGGDTSFSLWDGSGLSRHNLISPYHIVIALRYMYLSKYQSLYMQFLPSVGEGTLERRFKDFPGNIRAKTGSLHAVSCLSGYLRMDEHDYCFSMMFNNFSCRSERIEELQEAIIMKLYEILAPEQAVIPEQP